MTLVITHAKVNNLADWTQAELDQQIALGFYPPGTLIADITVNSDWNEVHTLAGTTSVAQGGTGLSSVTANALIKGNGASAMLVTGITVDANNVLNIPTGGGLTCPGDSGGDSLLLGDGATGGGLIDITVLGAGASVGYDGSIAIGTRAYSGGLSSALAIGTDAAATVGGALALGSGSEASTPTDFGDTFAPLAVGKLAQATNNLALAFGNGAVSSALNATAFGSFTSATGASSTIIGFGVSDGGFGSVVNIGGGTATAAGQVLIGGNSATAYILGTVTATNPKDALTLTSTSGTAGSNKDGTAILIQPGTPTGNNVSNAYLSFLTPIAGASGGTAQTQVERLRIGRAPAAGSPGEAVWNDSGADYDIRIEGDTDANLFFTDASTDRVGVGNNAPSYKFHVTGKMYTTDEIEIDGALNHDGTTVGFYGVAPTTRPTAYTQTYATATRTHAALTSATLTDNSGGTANTTVQALPDPADTPADADTLRDDLVTNLIPALRNNIADIVAQINALRVDLENAKQVLNQTIDDHQLNGLLQ